MASFLWDEPIDPADAGELTSVTHSIVEATQSFQMGGENQSGFANKGPITIAVFGPWGSGKTSVLRCIQHHFEHAPATRRAATVWFEPWRYEREENLIVPLLTELTSVVTQSTQDKRIQQAAVKTGIRLLGRVAKAGARTAAGFLAKQVGVKSESIEEIGKDFLSFYEGESERYEYPVSENEAFKEDFQELIRLAGSRQIKGAQKRPVCIFIDDLDRCSSNQVQRLLESMKNFLWADGVTYVLALDREQVTMALAEQHLPIFDSMGETALLAAKERAKNYMEKFFLYSFNLSNGSQHYEQNIVMKARDNFFIELQSRLSNKTFADNVDWQELKELFEQTGLNLRRVKRVLRWLYYELHMAKIDVELSAHFAELIISENYSVIWLDVLAEASTAMRRGIYRSLVSLLGTFNDPDSEEWNIDPTIREVYVDFLGSDNDEQQVLDHTQVQELKRIKNTSVGALVLSLLVGRDDGELKRVFVLSKSASQLKII